MQIGGRRRKKETGWINSNYILDKADFKIRNVVKDKGHHIMIKGSIQQDDITVVDISTPNIGAHKYIKANINRQKKRKWQ